MTRVAWVVIAAVGCTPARAPAPAPSNVGRPTACPDPAQPLIVVGGEAGLVQVNGDGAAVAVLSRTPTSFPLWTAGRAALVFLASNGELHRYDVATCTESVIARLPATTFAP